MFIATNYRHTALRARQLAWWLMLGICSLAATSMNAWGQDTRPKKLGGPENPVVVDQAKQKLLENAAKNFGPGSPTYGQPFFLHAISIACCTAV